jgi:hypothetical protein
MDTIIINPDTTQTTLKNTNSTPNPTSIFTIPIEDENSQPSLDDMLEMEASRVNTLQHTHGRFAETHWAKYLNVKKMDDDDLPPRGPSKDVEWFTTKEEQQAIIRAQRRERKADQLKCNREVMNWLTHEANENGINGIAPTTIPASKAETRHESDCEYTERWCNHRAIIALINKTDDNDALKTIEVQNLIDSKHRITHLKSKLDQLYYIAQTQTPQENEPLIHAANVVTDQEFTIDRGDNTSLQATNPFANDHIEEILQQITIGPDLTVDQREEVRALIRKYADVFALSLSEVQVVDWYKHHFNVDPTAQLPRKTAQRPVTEAQKDWFFSILDEMENAHIIQRVPGDFIKALSSTNVQPKEARKIGATRTEILRKVNAKCIKNGPPTFWEEVCEPGKSDEAMLEAVENQAGTEIKTKWRLCHTFTALNKATQIPTFPQGDLKAKQEFAASHQWASVIDFSAGYYAVPLDDESVPYVTFYVEGHSYYIYLQMLFRLTGAPAMCCEMVAIALEDMISHELVNWMDNICLPGDDFTTKIQNLRKFFIPCCDRGLSLSPLKTKLLFTDVLFAGAMVGPEGIKPNLDNVAAVAN